MREAQFMPKAIHPQKQSFSRSPSFVACGATFSTQKGEGLGVQAALDRRKQAVLAQVPPDVI